MLKEDLDYTKDPLSIKRYYIGRAEPQRFNNRKSEHRRNLLTDNGDMYQALSDLERDYDTSIEFIVLEEVYTTTHSREWYWIEQSLEDGHPLLNTKPGDIDRTTSGAYATKSKPTARNVEVFENAEWVKGAPRANKNEKSTHLFGAQFLRQGKSKLRFIHPDYGYQSVGALNMTERYKKAILMLTPGTPEYDKMIADRDMSIRLVNYRYHKNLEV